MKANLLKVLGLCSFLILSFGCRGTLAPSTKPEKSSLPHEARSQESTSDEIGKILRYTSCTHTMADGNVVDDRCEVLSCLDEKGHLGEKIVFPDRPSPCKVPLTKP